MIEARRRERHGRDGIRDRHAQPVRQQKGRTHLVHELLIHDPATQVREALGLDQNMIVCHRRGIVCKDRDARRYQDA